MMMMISRTKAVCPTTIHNVSVRGEGEHKDVMEDAKLVTYIVAGKLM